MSEITPSEGGVSPASGAGAPAPAEAEVKSGDLWALLSASSLSKSEIEKILVSLYAHSPTLAFGSFGSLYSAGEGFTKEQYYAFRLEIENKKHEIISAMLDAWGKNIEEIKEQRKRERLSPGYQRWLEEQTAAFRAKKENEESIERKTNVRTAGNYEEYLRSLTLPQREKELSEYGEAIVANYFDRAKDPVVQNSDLSKNALPGFLMEVMVVVPLAFGLAVTPQDPKTLSTQIAVKQVSDSAFGKIPPEYQAQVLPAVNFFVMDMVKNATVTLFLKGHEGEKKSQDLDFARAFGEKVLDKVRTEGYIKEELINNIPGAEQMPKEAVETAVMLVKLFALANVIMLFVKIEQGGTLQERELKEMLKEGKGIPDPDHKAAREVVQELNRQIESIEDPARREEFVVALLKYVDSQPDTEKLTSWMHALNSATEEVSVVDRTLNTSD